MIVLDTAALIYWTLDPERLSPPAQIAVRESPKISISSISIWEVALLVKRQKLILPLSIKEYVERLEKLASLEILPVDTQTWLDNLELDWEHRDPADRTIVALAKRLDCPLITPDQRILSFYEKAIW